MKFEKSNLKNGLTILTVPMPSLESATVTVWVNTGSRKEERKTNGISHFLEHMTFKGSKKRPSARAIAEAVDSFGGEFNASTSKEWTNFYIKSRAANLNVAFDVLSDMVLNPILDPTEIEREKGVIVEEINMYEDTPLWKVWEVFETLIFAGNKLSWDIAGSPETVRATKQKDFINYRQTHYYPKNMLVSVVGSVTQKQVTAHVEKYLSNLKNGRSKSEPQKFVSKQKGAQLRLHAKKKEQAHFVLGFPSSPLGDKNRFKETLIAAILGGGMSSRLFTEVRERRGLAYSVKTDVERLTDTGYIAGYAGVDPKKAEEAIKVMLDQFYGLAEGRYDIGEIELKKAKEYVKGHLALSLEDTHDVSRLFGARQLLTGKIDAPEDLYTGIDAVTKDEIVAHAKKLFVHEKLNLAIIGPYKSESKFEKLIK